MMNRRDVFLTGLVAFSGLLNIALGLRVLSLEKSLRPVPRVRTGTRLEDILGIDPAGNPLTIRFADSQNPTVLLVLRPGCAWCDQNMPNWLALIRAKSGRFRFVVVSLSPLDLKGYLSLNNLSLPAVFPLVGENPTLNGITITPQTIVVGPDGIVQQVWFGAYTKDLKKNVESFFRISLPVEIRPAQ
jgi:hypothetical protein